MALELLWESDPHGHQGGSLEFSHILRAQALGPWDPRHISSRVLASDPSSAQHPTRPPLWDLGGTARLENLV